MNDFLTQEEIDNLNRGMSQKAQKEYSTWIGKNPKARQEMAKLIPSQQVKTTPLADTSDGGSLRVQGNKQKLGNGNYKKVNVRPDNTYYSKNPLMAGILGIPMAYGSMAALDPNYARAAALGAQAVANVPMVGDMATQYMMDKLYDSYLYAQRYSPMDEYLQWRINQPE